MNRGTDSSLGREFSELSLCKSAKQRKVLCRVFEGEFEFEQSVPRETIIVHNLYKIFVLPIFCYKNFCAFLRSTKYLE